MQLIVTVNSRCYHTQTNLFPVISLIGHDQEPTIIDEIAEEVLQTTRHNYLHRQQQFVTLYCITEQQQGTDCFRYRLMLSDYINIFKK